MNTKRKYRMLALVVALLFSLVSSQALAGIIITEGKISRCVLTLKSAQGWWNLGEWPEDGEGCAPPSDISEEDEETDEESDESAHYLDEEDEDLDLDDEELGDLDATPDGYTCSDLGNGLELCEEEDEEGDGDEAAQGAGAGSANGGSWAGYAAADGGVDADSGDETVGGCQAGAPADPSLLFAVLALVRGFALRRREPVS